MVQVWGARRRNFEPRMDTDEHGLGTLRLAPRRARSGLASLTGCEETEIGELKWESGRDGERPTRSRVAAGYCIVNYKRSIRSNFHSRTGRPRGCYERDIVGAWHKVSARHLPAHLDEMCFRFNNRKNPCLFRNTIIKLIQTRSLEYKELTGAVAAA